MTITFYPTLSRGEAGKYATISRALLPASSWAASQVRKYGQVRTRLPVPRLPSTVVDRAADSGGFAVTRKWGRRYPYKAEQYVEWLAAWHPTWAAFMDYCCEPERTPGHHEEEVRASQHQTTTMAYQMWTDYHAVPWIWIPTIQGWDIGHYLAHASMMKPLIEEMAAFYGPDSPFRIGIGTLCTRANAPMLRELVTLLAQFFPGLSYHLWGVKLKALRALIPVPPTIKSIDSAVWNGRFHPSKQNEWKSSGHSLIAYSLRVALPAYEAKLLATLGQVQTASLSSCSDSPKLLVQRGKES